MKQQIITILLFLIITSSAKAQCKYYNKLDKNGKKMGLWLSYWDKKKTIYHTKFHYKNGREIGVNKTYNRDGKLMTKERHVKGRIKVKIYDEQGKLQRKGWAKIDFNAENLHFYWHGRWKFYNEKHQLVGISMYEKGFFINSIENKRTKRNQIKE
ncbi:MAG: hypothetical protein GY834_14330 [Bacteroidetes bacterium]|nr:hypothetical protein [Bacteroidota bacterium]